MMTVATMAMEVQFQQEPNRYDVNASVFELYGGGSDGAYDLIMEAETGQDIGSAIGQYLSDGFGLSNSPGPFRLSIQIGQAGTGDDLPLG